MPRRALRGVSPSEDSAAYRLQGAACVAGPLLHSLFSEPHTTTWLCS